jgi:hypothetical protein
MTPSYHPTNLSSEYCIISVEQSALGGAWARESDELTVNANRHIKHSIDIAHLHCHLKSDPISQPALALSNLNMIQAARSDLCPNNLNIALALHFPAYERPNMQHASSPVLFFSIILAPSQTPDMQRLTPPCFSSQFFFTLPPPLRQRTDIPDRFVNILVAIFIAASSWKSNLAAYGIWICETLVLFLQGLHSKD